MCIKILELRCAYLPTFAAKEHTKLLHIVWLFACVSLLASNLAYLYASVLACLLFV